MQAKQLRIFMCVYGQTHIYKHLFTSVYACLYISNDVLAILVYIFMLCCLCFLQPHRPLLLRRHAPLLRGNRGTTSVHKTLGAAIKLCLRWQTWRGTLVLHCVIRFASTMIRLQAPPFQQTLSGLNATVLLEPQRLPALRFVIGVVACHLPASVRFARLDGC